MATLGRLVEQARNLSSLNIDQYTNEGVPRVQPANTRATNGRSGRRGGLFKKFVTKAWQTLGIADGAVSLAISLKGCVECWNTRKGAHVGPGFALVVSVEQRNGRSFGTFVRRGAPTMRRMHV